MNTDSELISEITLSEEEVNLLLYDKSSESRAAVGARIASNYEKEELGEKERKIAEQIFRLLLKDTEVKVRSALSHNLKNSTEIPRDIVIAMAHDVTEVSLPILECSQVLDDSDLLDIIHSTRENEKFLAISKRNIISEIVSDTLVSKGDDKVIDSLINNDGAAISENVFSELIDDYKENPVFMETLTTRARLPIGVVEKLVSMVSDSLADTLKERYKLPGESIKKEVEKGRETETLKIVRQTDSPEEINDLIIQLKNSGRLTPSLILSSLCQGNFVFFEYALAALSNIPAENARTLIADRGDLGFRAIYNKSCLPETMFPAVKLLLKIIKELESEGENPVSSRYNNQIIERILQYAEETPVENISYIIAMVRRAA